MRCPACTEAPGWQILRIKTALYACGFYTAARICRTCNGHRRTNQTAGVERERADLK